jgi:thiamine biosynthesis lipoprotein
MAVEGKERIIRFAAMGTHVAVHIRDGISAGAMIEVRDLFERWERTLSRFRGDSDVSRLNRAGGAPLRVDRLTRQVVAASLRAAQATNGVFDPTLGRQLAAHGYEQSFELPRSGGTTSGFRVEPGGGWRSVRIDPIAGTVTVPAPVALDLGGIAKGMAVDAAVRLLERRGARAALVNAGGDLRVAGEGATAWRVALEDAPGEEVTIARGAIATSSTARRRWQQGDAERHHLIDPATGAPSHSGSRSVSVFAATCAQAEVAAKTALLLGPEEGAVFLAARRLPGVTVGEDGEVTYAGAWPRRSVAA